MPHLRKAAARARATGNLGRVAGRLRSAVSGSGGSGRRRKSRVTRKRR